MPRVLGLGDNTVDIYVDQGMQYPGGNSLNFAVYARRLGASSHYMGCIGNDAFGAQIEEALIQERVECPRLRRTANETSWSRVRHSNGDRWFDGSHLYCADEYRLTMDDQAYLSQFDLVHIGVNSMLDDKIGMISQASQRLSYDFSDKYTASSLDRVAPYIRVAVLSGADTSLDQARALASRVSEAGVEIVLVTRGALGAICLSQGAYYEQGIIKTDVVDTLGAGDAFTAAFIIEHLRGSKIQAAMHVAAKFASRICQVEAAFGLGRKAVSVPVSNQRQEEAVN